MISTSAFLIRFSIVIAVLLLIDIYVFRGIKTASSSISSVKTKQVIYWSYWLINIAFVLCAIYAVLTFDRSAPPRNGIFVFLFGVFVLLTIPKLIFSLFLLTEDIFRILRGVVVAGGRVVAAETMDAVPAWVGRRKFISQLGMGVAAVPFVSILYGIVKGKYNYKVHKATIAFKDLPAAFDGFTITHISDVHAGSFDSTEDVKRGLEMINEQNSDVILFTGDLVNNMANEMDPWIPLFSNLKARHGKYSITGNHDYGDYTEWESEEKKRENFESFKEVHKKIGFKLLMNENTYIEKDGQRIALLGMENWGKGGFSKYGDFSKTLSGIDSSEFKILMSHDPSHWDEEVSIHKEHIHLALAGHTHGMQFGVEIPWIKWSPIKYRYPHWAGLYTSKGRNLYVNRGFGFLGFPGRVGIWPEITVITLQKA